MATMRLKADYQQLNPDHPHRHEGKSSYMYATVVHILVICVKNLTYLRQKIMSLEIHKYQEPQLKRVRLDVFTMSTDDQVCSNTTFIKDPNS